ncbi:M48 family metalloprotease [Pseudocolwellia sp. AS88]|uniref:beta-barrel assembly-enhancing protease n=1 Tax=Pseudocolwellia TaxID=2848177 RepID=UPI0026F09E6E|nr:M48 family metalloprotease [Pseudocolwellia sp. AS88]MDO7084640.1 M48 family metalloprotease [Pseudocolwellia sp. AS88]
MLKTKKLILSMGLSLALTTAPIFAQDSKNKLPSIGAAGFSALSIDKEQLIGNAMMRQLRASQPILHDPVLSEYINSLGNLLVKNANDVNYAFEFFIINSKELNAFAFFGGHIGIHSGLITTAANESELASVIAHEISHVTQRHLARRLEEQTRTQSLSMAGIASGILLALVNPGLGMAALSTSLALTQQAGINYTRGNEKEADRVGIALLANSGFDPQGAPNFFGKMAEQYRYVSKVPAMLLTHPLPDSRVSDARIRAQNYPSVNLKPSLAFELTQARITARYENNSKANVSRFEDLLRTEDYKIKEAALYGLAISHYENKSAIKAREILETLLQADPNNLYYVDVLSDVYIETKQFDKAITLLSRLNSLMPNNQIVALNYANVLQEANQLDQASNVLQDLLIAQPEHFVAYDLLTTIYRKQDKIGQMHAAKAEVFVLLGIYPKAIDELQNGIKFSKDTPLFQKRLKARILQLREQEEKLKRL